MFVHTAQLDGCAATQHLDRLEKGDNRNLMKSNEGKYQVLSLRRNNPIDQYRLGDGWLESSFARKALRVLVDTKLNMSQQHAVVAK